MQKKKKKKNLCATEKKISEGKMNLPVCRYAFGVSLCLLFTWLTFQMLSVSVQTVNGYRWSIIKEKYPENEKFSNKKGFSLNLLHMEFISVFVLGGYLRERPRILGLFCFLPFATLFFLLIFHLSYLSLTTFFLFFPLHFLVYFFSFDGHIFAEISLWMNFNIDLLKICSVWWITL